MNLWTNPRQTVFAQNPQQQPRAEGGILVLGSEPKVPPLPSGHISGFSSDYNVQVQRLDGLNCDGCVVEAAIVTYAGGEFRCVNCRLKGDSIVLKGAALNTFIMLQQIGAFLKTPKEAPAPRVKIAADKIGAKLTLVSHM